MSPFTGLKDYVQMNRILIFVPSMSNGPNPTNLKMGTKCYFETSAFTQQTARCQIKKRRFSDFCKCVEASLLHRLCTARSGVLALVWPDRALRRACSYV